MRLHRLQIINYKGFRDSGWLSFGPGFNVIVGQNNAGKTALLETLRLHRCEHRPYRGLPTDPSTPLNPISVYNFEVGVSGEELRSLCLRVGGHLDIPVETGVESQRAAFIQKFFSLSEIRFLLTTWYSTSAQSTRYPSHGLFVAPSQHLSATVAASADKSRLELAGGRAGDGDSLPAVINASIEGLLYVFKPERLNVGTSSIQDTDILYPDAGNLPAVLSKLQGNSARFDRFNNHVNSIFPSIKRVVIVPSTTAANSLDIRIWTVDPKTEREDLAVRLQESGTGIGQVLAILYVAMTRRSNIIAIDEPNSFLHPGAAKKLLQILKLYDQNQYIISTHSPELIAVANPENIHLVSWDGEKSVVEQLDHNSIASMNRVLTDVGASLSDVFGADRVIWVEGPTEQACFPKVVAKSQGSVPLGLVFAPLRNTGDLEAKGAKANAIWEIYERLTHGPAILPPVIGFSFDREGRSDQHIEDMKRRSKGRAQFLPRATYENFLLHPDAIAAVLSDDLRRLNLSKAIARTDIEAWLSANCDKYARKTKPDSDFRNEHWLRECDAPRLLYELFQDVSGGLLTYHKLTHSIALTEWLIHNDLQWLAELSTYLTKLVTSDEPAEESACRP